MKTPGVAISPPPAQPRFPASCPLRGRGHWDSSSLHIVPGSWAPGQARVPAPGPGNMAQGPEVSGTPGRIALVGSGEQLWPKGLGCVHPPGMDAGNSSHTKAHSALSTHSCGERGAWALGSRPGTGSVRKDVSHARPVAPRVATPSLSLGPCPARRHAPRWASALPTPGIIGEGQVWPHCTGHGPCLPTMP